MLYLKPKFTLPAGPSKSTACERCVWGRGEHAAWCLRAVGFANGCPHGGYNLLDCCETAVTEWRTRFGEGK
jgi:hypothetical protein